jgi:hypothetical protein
MGNRIIEFLCRNLQEVFGERDAARRRVAIQKFYAEDCVLPSHPVSLLDTTLWTSSPETSARHTHFVYTPHGEPQALSKSGL